MPSMSILTESELRDLVALDLDAVACVENAFTALASGRVVMPPILRLDIHESNGEVDVKTAYVPGLDGFAIKISPGFFDNPKLGLPSVNGLMVFFSAKTGMIEALLLDNGYLTDVRTAAAGAVAAKHLSRQDSQTAAVFGAGVQAQLQLKALTLVRPIRQARIWGRHADKAIAAAKALSDELGISVTAVSDPSATAKGADIVVTTTPADAPIFHAEWLEAGQHVTAMGSDAEHKNELDPAVFARADHYVADSLSQTRRLGELHHAIDAGVVPAERDFPELGAVIAGGTPLRRSDGEITLCDLTGTGVQDTAIAALTVARAETAQRGTRFDA
ncbi:ectoine utilization protein EutC [Pelagibius sp. Alg239-R121]|uniref:ectoine utilization protein EutC n=1 Tax=Pelagibius sp. Alg239-R121 TaxID=2993448 RepID=UPI0024A6D768|nr:ectoine utilization protein EutC [Pelagibius sp. Alg239-R121]